jgi:hypothetical protein
MIKKNTRFPKTVAPLAVVVLLACSAQVFAQNSSAGGVNRPPETGQTPPATTPPAPARSESGATGSGSVTVGRVPGHTGQVSTVEEKRDPVVEQSEKEVSKRIKNICRGC